MFNYTLKINVATDIVMYHIEIQYNQWPFNYQIN